MGRSVGSRALVLLALTSACASSGAGDGDPARDDAAAVPNDAAPDAPPPNPDAAIPPDAPCATPWYLDADLDGHGDPEVEVEACTAPEGYVASNDDCNDATLQVYPGNPEICDTVDNDCDALTVETCPAQCTPSSFTSRAYLFCAGSIEWDDARAFCSGQTMRLVRLDDVVENGWVRDTATLVFGGGDIHIGGNDRIAEGGWEWDDGGDFWLGGVDGAVVGAAFVNWNGDEPNQHNGEEDCAEMQPDGQWNDVPCTTVQEFVCEHY